MGRLAIYALLVLLPVAYGYGQDSTFKSQLAEYISQAPLKMSYEYTFISDDLARDTKGDISIGGGGLFRLQLWDKIYASDGQSLYLHDRNTEQTVIDSLLWDDLNLWIRFLNGDLPEDVSMASSKAVNGSRQFDIVGDAGAWHAEILIDTTTAQLKSIRMTDGNGYKHMIEVDVPEELKDDLQLEYYRLEDLPGTRLDLR